MNTMPEFAAFVIGIAGSFLAAVAVPYVFRWILLPLARRTPTTLDVRILEAIRTPVQLAVFAAGLNAAIRLFSFSTDSTAYRGAWSIFQGSVYVFLVFALTLAAYMATRALIEWYHAEVAAKTASLLDDQFAPLFRKVAKFLFFFIGLTILMVAFALIIFRMRGWLNQYIPKEEAEGVSTSPSTPSA